MTKSLNSKETVEFESVEDLINVVGFHNNHLALIEEYFPVSLNQKGNKIEINGENSVVTVVKEIFEQFSLFLESNKEIEKKDIMSAIRLAQQGKIKYFQKMLEEVIGRDRNDKPIHVKNVGQRNYVQAAKTHDIVFGIGPAGTGKTFLAVVMAVSAMRAGEVKRIILTRPAVEAGESLGFLPGDLKEKVDPYLRPLYDSLYTIFGVEHTNRLMERGTIEVAPLAYMRGRTLDDAFIILDEAQNTTVPQMKMFLTRLGFGSKIIINGDITQIDLPKRVNSGLIHAEKVLHSVKGISFVHFDAQDVVRHPLVSTVIDAYEKAEDN
ncbi:PhoH family protein [Lacticigenium naphthae]|uniref:PhoH family protein n=1 Tax=Lacticigenium naphthae TaxID=515351 RepID=UPI00041C6AFC|nr:PhoH family protein [Lacticigenium naphthae]